jgi:hypothetical protein
MTGDCGETLFGSDKIAVPNVVFLSESLKESSERINIRGKNLLEILRQN